MTKNPIIKPQVPKPTPKAWLLILHQAAADFTSYIPFPSTQLSLQTTVSIWPFQTRSKFTASILRAFHSQYLNSTILPHTSCWYIHLCMNIKWLSELPHKICMIWLKEKLQPTRICSNFIKCDLPTTRWKPFSKITISMGQFSKMDWSSGSKEVIWWQKLGADLFKGHGAHRAWVY